MPSDPRPRSGTYPRGEDTKRRIVEAALEIFATDGYEGASTRRLAEHAGVNLPALSYYFGGKEGLYAAVVAHIVENLETMMEPVSGRVRKALAGPLPKVEALTLLCDILEAFVALVTDGTGNPESRRLFFARTEIEDSPVLAPMHDCFRRLVLEPCTALIGRLLDQRPDDGRTLMRTLSIIGQVVVFCKIGTRRVLGTAEYNPDQVQTIQDLVREHTQAIFHAAVAGGGT